MSSLSSFFEQQILDYLLRGVDFVTTGPVYMSVHTDDPLDDGSDEVVGGGYIRQLVDVSGWTAAAPVGEGSECTNVDDIIFEVMPACTVTHIAFWDSATSGNFLWGSDALETPVAVSSGHALRFTAGDVHANMN